MFEILSWNAKGGTDAVPNGRTSELTRFDDATKPEGSPTDTHTERNRSSGCENEEHRVQVITEETQRDGDEASSQGLGEHAQSLGVDAVFARIGSVSPIFTPTDDRLSTIGSRPTPANPH